MSCFGIISCAAGIGATIFLMLKSLILIQIGGRMKNLIHYFSYERIHYHFHRPDGMGDDQRKNREMKYYKITGPDNRQTGITEHELAEIMQRVIEIQTESRDSQRLKSVRRSTLRP
jgi:hypothetical protein